ncbi:hypothetical protein [Streptosporangium sp. NPDC051022]|uniref:hypothetical protein n=1 Tax=Streptosporangium sp. NPDC051022 TaxID=3155752 RepID=UPI0034357E09
MSQRRDWTVLACVALVAVATVVASFTAQAGLGELAGWVKNLHLFGVEVSMSWLLPVTVDAYGIAATRIATNKRRYSAEVRAHAFGHALAAVVVSVLGNAMYHLLEARVIVLGSAAWVLVVAVSVVPPIALGGLAHLLGIAARDEVEAVAVPANPAHVSDLVEVEPVAVPANRAHVRDLVEGSGAEVVEEVEPGTPNRFHGNDLPADVPDVPASSPAPTPVLTPAPDELFPVAAERYADALAEGQVPALTRIKKELRVGQPRAARIRGYLLQLAQP